MQRQHHRQPHEKTRLAGLVMEQPHPRKAAQRAPQKAQPQQSGLRDAPAVAHRLPLVDAECGECSEVYPGEIEKHNRTKHNETLPCWVHSKSKRGGCQEVFPSQSRFARLPSQALRASSPAGRAKCTSVNREKLCGKAHFLQLCLTTHSTGTNARALGSPHGGAVMPLCGMTERGA